MRGGHIEDIDVGYHGAVSVCGRRMSVVRVEFVVENELLFQFLDALKAANDEQREPIMAIINHSKEARR